MASYQPDPRMVQFFEKEVAPHIMPLFNGNYPHLEIQKNYNDDLLEFQKIYRERTLNVSLCDKPPKDSAGENALLPFGCSLEGGKPILTLFVSEIEKIFRRLRNFRPTSFKPLFETVLVIGIMHEIDHLILQKMGNQRDNVSLVIGDECAVWARTCERCMRPLVEVYGKELPDSDGQVYSAWVASGRNAESARWRDFIASLYGNFKRR